jgi:uncharacterized membrane protein
MSQSNPYEAPAANLDQTTPASNRPLNSNWDIGAVLSEAWALTSGFKATFWGAFLLYMGVAFLFAILGAILAGGLALVSTTVSLVVGILLQVVQMVISAPLMAGLMMIGVKRAEGIPVNAFMIFNYFPKTLPLFLSYLLVMLLVVIGMVLLVIPGIYLLVAYALALPLLVDKNLSIWQALETSRKGLTACWFRFLGLGIVNILIIMLSAIPLGIGLIWTLPFAYIALGIVYRDLFGVSSK